MSWRRILAGVLIGIAVLSVMMPAIVSGREGARLSSLERVVVIHLQGTIEDVGGSWDLSGVITPRRVARQLERAVKDNSIKAVVLRINSPGGSVAASQKITTLIRDCEKPVVVSMGDMAASGGYYISAPADGIVAHPGTMTGSIGVILSVMKTEGLYEKLGVQVETIKSGQHKDMFARKYTDEERRLLQKISDEHDQYYYRGGGRPGTGEGLCPETGHRPTHLGTQALELGLVDRQIGGIRRPLPWRRR